MQKKNVLIIVLTVLVFLSTAILGFSTVYRVGEVAVNASLVSDEAKAETDQLQARLQETYEKQSIFSCDQTEAEEIVAEFAYFRFVSFEKDHPNRLVVSISEDAEVYALETGTGSYYILGANGMVLGVRDSYINRSDDTPNILIGGLTVTGEKGQPLQGDDCLEGLFSFGQNVSSLLGGIRRNVLSIEVSRPAATEEEMRFILKMREGVKIYIRNPLSRTEEMAKKAVDAYLGCSSAERLTGMIWVTEGESGINTQYYENTALPV